MVGMLTPCASRGIESIPRTPGRPTTRRATGHGMDCAIQLGWIEFDRLRDLAQAAEGLGFKTIYFPDHLVAEGPERQAMGVPAFDPMIQAAIVADATKKLRVGHLVLCNLFRHPAVTARSLATLDHLSGGRMIAGLGSG